VSDYAGTVQSSKVDCRCEIRPVRYSLAQLTAGVRLGRYGLVQCNELPESDLAGTTQFCTVQLSAGMSSD
jgi:hypothetical protein